MRSYHHKQRLWAIEIVHKSRFMALVPKNYDVIKQVTAFVTEFYCLLARQKLKFPP